LHSGYCRSLAVIYGKPAVVNSTSKEVVQLVEEALRQCRVDERRVRAWLDGIRSKIEVLESELEQLRDKNAEVQHGRYRIRYDR
jgi:hypothetical protein